MAKFIKLENKLINVDKIEIICENKVISKHGNEWYDEDEYEVKGIVVFLNNFENGVVFESISMDEMQGYLEC